MRPTCVIQIGNTDNKLSQSDWAHFAEEMSRVVSHYAGRIHFCGGSDWNASWQNACWVFELNDPKQIDDVKEAAAAVGNSWYGNKVAFTFGDTEILPLDYGE